MPITHTNPSARPIQGQRRRHSSQTGNYSPTVDESGTHFDTQGAGGNVIFTLPAVSGAEGVWYTFFAAEDQLLRIGGPLDTLIVDNDLAADTIGFETATELIGGAFHAICDGAFWHVSPWLPDEVATLTIVS